MIELDIEHSQVPSVQPRHEAPSRLRPPQRSRVAGAKKYKHNTKYNTNTYNTKYTPPSGVFSFPVSYHKRFLPGAQRPAPPSYSFLAERRKVVEATGAPEATSAKRQAMLHAEAVAALEPKPLPCCMLPWRALRVALSMHRPGAARCAAVRPCRCACCVPSPPPHPPTHRQP
jgi:hypothetical protein